MPQVFSEAEEMLLECKPMHLGFAEILVLLLIGLLLLGIPVAVVLLVVFLVRRADDLEEKRLRKENARRENEQP